LITDAPGDAQRTWRPALATRIAQAFSMGVFPTVPAAILAATLATNHVAHGGWISLALALAAWGFLARRALAQSLTLTPDTLVIKNIFTTKRIPFADVTEVSFHRGKPKVASQHGTFASERNAIASANLGFSYWSGRRSRGDAIADAITDAAGLPPLPPRQEIISPNRARIILVVAVVVFGFGLYLGPVGSLALQHRSFAAVEVGAVLYVFGGGGLAFAVCLALDHRRKRRVHK
jgi:hypothetical protein